MIEHRTQNPISLFSHLPGAQEPGDDGGGYAVVGRNPRQDVGALIRRRAGGGWGWGGEPSRRRSAAGAEHGGARGGDGGGGPGAEGEEREGSEAERGEAPAPRGAEEGGG